MYGDGLGFVPDVLLPDAEVLLAAQAPGADEEAGRKIVGWEGREPRYIKVPPQPLIGRTGWEADKYLAMSGLDRTMVSRANILKCRMMGPKGKKVNDLPKGKILTAATEHCMREHFRVLPAVKLIVASGGLAWKALGGPGTVTEWRGFLKP